MKTYFYTSVLCINFLCVTAEKGQEFVVSAPCIKQETRYEKLLKDYVSAEKNYKTILDENNQAKKRESLWAEENNEKIIALEQAIKKEKKRNLAKEAFTTGCNGAHAESKERRKTIKQETKQLYKSLQEKNIAQLVETSKKFAEQYKKLRKEKEKIVSEIMSLLEKIRQKEMKEEIEKNNESGLEWGYDWLGKSKRELQSKPETNKEIEEGKKLYDSIKNDKD